MDQSTEKNLFEKYGNGTITEQELLLLHNWYFEQTKSEQPYPDAEVFKKRMEEMDLAVLGPLQATAQRKIRFRKYAAHAACLLVAASFTFYFILQETSKRKREAVYATEIAPGGPKAMLFLANGQRIDLSRAPIGDLARQQGTKITKTAEGKLIYIVTGQHTAPAEYNTIETPKGGQYMVCLPDGTKVWLNAASTLKYPAAFSSLSERRVILSGEAYFEVFHNAKQPFVVQNEHQSVRDIGTRFNINAYPGEPGVKTSLLEGSVAVIANRSAQKGAPLHQRVLQPGQQAVVWGGEIQVSESNTAESISWKNGFFQFHNDDLETGMRQISRWYNVEVKYEGTVPHDRLDGKVRRGLSLAKALEILLRPNIPYRIEGRKVTILDL